YADAWALAAPALRAQLDGYDAFTAQFSSVRSIRFQRLGVAGRSGDAATVAFATTARHTDRVDHCSGTATAAPSGSGGDWQVQHITVSCG
ncbi:MAG TPA: hypothetical protein VLB47_04695, partial [Solirubrobacteraceae bacterium]|nr:hypothetical protein [Solirubrobacteraceae bacterium]